MKKIIILIQLVLTFSFAHPLNVFLIREQQKIISPKIILKHKFILFNSEYITINNSPIKKNDYTLDYINGVLILKNWKMFHNKTILILYKYTEVKIKPLYSAENYSNKTNISEPQIRKITLPNNSIHFIGNKTFSLSVDDNNSFDFNQSLFLSFTGQLYNGMNIKGVLSDNTTSMKSGSLYLSEIDNIYIQFDTQKYRFKLGDISAQYRNYTVKNEVKLRGISAEINTKSYILAGAYGERKTLTKSVEIQLTTGIFSYNIFDIVGEKFDIIPTSETLYLNSKLLTNGIANDYTMDYESGIINLSNNIFFSDEDRLTVYFRYSTNSFPQEYITANSKYSNIDSSITITSSFLQISDEKNKLLNGNLSDQERNFLAIIDTISEYSEIDTVNIGEGNYITKLDTTSNIYYFYFKPDSGIYNIKFFYVGKNNGDYIKNNDHFIYVGKYYGNYSYKKLVFPPKQTQNYNFGITYKNFIISNLYIRRYNNNIYNQDTDIINNSLIDLQANFKTNRITIKNYSLLTNRYFDNENLPIYLSTLWKKKMIWYDKLFFSTIESSSKLGKFNIEFKSSTLLKQKTNTSYKINNKIEYDNKFGIILSQISDYSDTIAYKSQTQQSYYKFKKNRYNLYFTYKHNAIKQNKNITTNTINIIQDYNLSKFKYHQNLKFDKKKLDATEYYFHIFNKIKYSTFTIEHNIWNDFNNIIRQSLKSNAQISNKNIYILKAKFNFFTSQMQKEIEKFIQVGNGEGDYTFDADANIYIYTPNNGNYIKVNKYVDSGELKNLNLTFIYKMNFSEMTKNNFLLTNLPLLENINIKGKFLIDEHNEYSSLSNFFLHFPYFFHSKYSVESQLLTHNHIYYNWNKYNKLSIELSLKQHYSPNKAIYENNIHIYRINWNFTPDRYTYFTSYCKKAKKFNSTTTDNYSLQLGLYDSEKKITFNYEKILSSYFPVIYRYEISSDIKFHIMSGILATQLQYIYYKFSSANFLLPFSFGIDKYKGHSLMLNLNYNLNLTNKTKITFHSNIIYHLNYKVIKKNISLNVDIQL